MRSALEVLGVPLGPTLAALLEQAPTCDYLDIGAGAVRERGVARMRELGLTPIGLAANGWFGVVDARLGPTVDATPVAYVDRQGLPPVVVARGLADFLSVLVFFPDFFEPTRMDAEAWNEARESIASDLEDEESDLSLLRGLLRLPGVRELTSGAQVVALLDGTTIQAPPHRD